MRNIGQKLFKGLNMDKEIEYINMYQLSFSNIFHQTNRFAPQGRFYNSCNSCSSICLTMHLKELTFVLGWGFVGVLMGLLLLFWCGFFCGFGGGGGGGVLVLFGFYISGFFSPKH